MNPKRFIGPIWTMAASTFDDFIFGFLIYSLLLHL